MTVFREFAVCYPVGAPGSALSAPTGGNRPGRKEPFGALPLLSMDPTDRTTDLLQTCPYCDYALTGLPTVHVCPECGGSFDRRWTLFGGKSRWSSLGMFSRCLSAVVLLGGAVFIPVFMLADGLSCGVLVWFPTVYLLWRSLLSRPPCFVVAGPEGIAIGHRRKNTLQRFAWSEIKSVDLGSSGRAIVETDEGTIRPDAWRGNVAEASRFAEYVEEELDERSGQSLGPEEPVADQVELPENR